MMGILPQAQLALSRVFEKIFENMVFLVLFF